VADCIGALISFRNKSTLTIHIIKIKRLNDQANIDYIPQPYNGQVAVIQTKGYFVGVTSPILGWDEYIPDGLKVHQLPHYPWEILGEPFCLLLADTLNQCLHTI